MKLYTVTYDELKEMTLADVNAMIEAIENDGGMISAEMADRLFGTEEKEYEHNQHTLRQLYQKRATFNPAYWECQKADLKKTLAWYESLNPCEECRKQIREKIVELRREIAICQNNIDNLKKA
jgi:hypothetical protein